MIHKSGLPTLRSIAVLFFMACAFLALAACAPAQPLQSKEATGSGAEIPAGFFVPPGFFGRSGNGLKQGSALPVISTASAAVVGHSGLPSPPRVPVVMLYTSPATVAYFASGGLDAKVNSLQWEVFLRKYKIPFQAVTSVEQLEKAPSGVLLLPSAVALSERERRAVIGFRAKGGGVLASWLTGVRNENGDWRGFDFMESALDVRVVGNTQAEEDDNFMMPYGDNPVTHSLPAGLRIWLERASEWHPLRLVGRHSAAQIMDWSRTFVSGRPGGAIVFDERSQSSGVLSRSVVLGYPERLWLSADPKFLEAIAHNALMWLLRQPDAYTVAWPHPYASAFVLAVDAAEIILDSDVSFAKSLEEVGGRASYYVLSENAAKSAALLKTIQARGHEVAYLGDRFEGFRDQSSGAQAKRLDTMRRVIEGAGLNLAADAGFHAPMESYDKATEKLLNERAFGYYVSFMDASDARLPIFASVDSPTGAATMAKPMIVLPRTQNGPEDAMAEGDPAIGLKSFLDELRLAEEMAGLSLVRIPNQSLLTNAQLAEIFEHLKAQRGQMWLATAGHVAQWWHERGRVSARLDPDGVAPQLAVAIKGEAPLKQAVTVWVNLPESGSSLRLVPRGNDKWVPKIVRVDAWRAAVVLEGLAPGEHRWNLYFDRPIASGTN